MGNGELVEKKIADIAKRYHYFKAVREQGFDFAGCRREVEALVNGSADGK